MSDEKGDGNFFHYLWSKAGTSTSRSEDQVPRLVAAPRPRRGVVRTSARRKATKAEQYPNDPRRGLPPLGPPYFDPEALKHYARRRSAKPLFQRAGTRPEATRTREAREGRRRRSRSTRAREGPQVRDRGDVATGTGTDYSVAAVIDLAPASRCAELYLHGDYDEFADQLHFLGLWYNTARLAVEKGAATATR
jgi:hypothetical protein